MCNAEVREFGEKVVEEVKRRPVLYLVSHPHYRERGVIDKAWREIAAELHSDADTVKKRWQNLRGSYSKFIKTGPKSGLGRFYLCDQMSFLAKHMTKRPDIKDCYPESDDPSENSIVPDENSDITQTLSMSVDSVLELQNPIFTQTTSLCTAQEYASTSNASVHYPNHKSAKYPKSSFPILAEQLTSRLKRGLKDTKEEPSESVSWKKAATAEESEQTIYSQNTPGGNPTPAWQQAATEFFNNHTAQSESPELLFFKGVIPLVQELSNTNKIHFYSDVMAALGNYMDKQEEDRQ